MNNEDSCPLDGSWAQECCSIYPDQLAEGIISGCIHRDGCIELKEVIVSNPNLSTLAIKAVLIDGIPDVLKDSSLVKPGC